ncbi:GNAT family N-acetyltransferase [Caulobacter vibrioides]|uniref:Acetyltransferase, GNAT family n=2 Tax=Caulobacter vibrioides TaxID=155892 RepID=Q9A3E3_CAUVC|nr:GNAT family N-acetyltransferase [Caulobacter vibrioides]YP_002518743.1 acetyltransferase [Caulobacter vibrioides NA1000]AAK25223.1 acetyltransferase, GNAT family [Caulobacter vibrioides CB15]ACL96835.1 acetyltransferase [Caulobacter vibrioides NA1000]ATC30089.1 N-acetyltransferase [Caulobacter vibrioides]QXZ51613.1 GNAT family N-acetyltransferase [Caulobacter vibrioides]
MPLTIRPARFEELPAVQAIERLSARRFVGWIDALADDDPSPLERLAERSASGGLLVADVETGEGPKAAGFVMFRPMEDSLYIEQIDVAPAFERRRIGATLINAVADRAVALGLSRLTLSTFREIPWNAPYYRRLGFVDLDDEALGPALAEVRREHLARGLDESARVFMIRKVP